MKKLLVMAAFALLITATPVTAQDALGVADAIVERVDQTARELQRAREALQTAKELGNQETIQERVRELRQKREAYQQAEQSLDEAKVSALSQASGRSEAEIRSMRESGMGWGRIAKETGVSPSVLGKGQSKAAKGNKGKGKMSNSADDADESVLGDVDDQPANSKGKGKGKSGKNKHKGKGKGKGKK